MKKLILLFMIMLFSITTVFTQAPVTMYYQYFDDIDQQYFVETSIVLGHTMAGDTQAEWTKTTQHSKYYVLEDSTELVLYGDDSYDLNAKVTIDLSSFGSFSDSLTEIQINLKVDGDSAHIETSVNFDGLTCAQKKDGMLYTRNGNILDTLFYHLKEVPVGIGVAQNYIATIEFKVFNTTVVYVDDITIHVHNKVPVDNSHARISYTDGNLFIDSGEDTFDNTLYIYNISGQLVYARKHVDLYVGRNGFKIPLDEGMYIVRVGDTNKKVFVK